MCALLLGEQLDGSGQRHVMPGGAWTLNDNVEATGRPRLVLQSAQHRADLEDLTTSEAQDLGVLLPQLVASFKAHSRAERIYVHLLNEAGHVHFHLVPRFRKDPVSRRGFALDPSSAAPGGARQLARAVAEDVSPTPPVETSPLVRAVVRGLSALQRLGPYELLRRYVPRARRAGSRFAELYVPAWVFVLAGSIALTDVQWLTVPLALVVLGRWLDLVTLHQLTLLDRSRQRLASSTRSLLLLALNLVELGAMTATGQRLLDVPLRPALRDSLRAVTLNGWPETAKPTVEALLATTTITALLLLTVALSTVVGLLSQNYREGH